MFEIGDIVYCINNTSILETLKYQNLKRDTMLRTYDGLFFDTPYIIKSVFNGISIKLEDMKDKSYHNNRFISEKEYQKSKRFNKIIKLKECLKKVT